MTLILNGTDNSATTPAVTGTDTDTGIYYPTSNQVAIATNGTQAMLVDASQNVTFAQAANLPNTFGFKNRIINGAMGIWQRGTTASLSNSYVYLTADRWETDMSSTAAATVSQSTSVPTATTQYSLKIQRTAASTSTGNIVAAQALETANSYDLAGLSITLSFWAKCGANYSATSSILGSFVFFGTGTDQSISNMRSNAWTGQTNASQNNTVSTAWTRFTQTVSCPASTTQVGMQFLFTPTGTAGADDSIFITGVQLEKGSTATSFDYRSIGTELALCERYCFVPASNSRYVGQCDATTRALMIYVFPQTMRTGPSATLASATSYTVTTATGGTVNSTAVSLGGGFINTAQLAITVASGLVAGNATIVTANGTTIFSAEL